jgi:hypothetical protein
MSGVYLDLLEFLAVVTITHPTRARINKALGGRDFQKVPANKDASPRTSFYLLHTMPDPAEGIRGIPHRDDAFTAL